MMCYIYSQSLPVLTIRGDSFPNRVAVSLVVSLDPPLYPHTVEDRDDSMHLSEVLVADTLMQYEDMAVRVAMSSMHRVERDSDHHYLGHDRIEGRNYVKKVDKNAQIYSEGGMVVLDYLKESLRGSIHLAKGIFCSVCSSITFIRGMQALYEVDQYALVIKQQKYSATEQSSRKLNIVLL